MKKPTIYFFLIFEHMCGNTTTTYDLFYFLKDLGYEVQFDFFYKNQVNLYSYRDYIPKEKGIRFIPFTQLREIDSRKFDVTICNAKHIMLCLNYNINFLYKRLLILTTASVLINSLNAKRLFYNEHIDRLKNKIILGHKNDSKLFTGDFEFYLQKFSAQRIESIQKRFKAPIQQSLLQANHYGISQKSQICIHPFTYSGYNYFRWCDAGNGLYTEHIGKLLFEFLFLPNRKVLYSPVNKTIDDGLTEYLADLGIDDSKQQELKANQLDLSRRLLTKEDDIIRVINRI